MIAQLVRFGGVGGMATLLHVITAILVRGAFGLAPLQANFAGFVAAVAFSYVGHARYTFGAELARGGQIQRFVFVALLGLLTSSVTVRFLDAVLGLPFVVAMLAVAIVVPAVTYIALRLWVFEASRSRENTDWPGLLLSGALAVAVCLLFWGRMINHDTAWYLIATRKWLAGAQLYVDLIEVNPPLNFYLTLPALGLADFFGVSDSNGAYLSFSILMFLILLWCHAILREELGFSWLRGGLMLVGIAVAMVAPALGDFGQREQILVILAMPWLLGELAPETAGYRQRIARAAVAAIGVCVKPYFVLFPLAVTVVNCVQRRSLWPILSLENLTFLGVGLAYIGFVALIHPAYFSQIVPIAQVVYGAYGAPIGEVAYPIALEIGVMLFPVLIAVLGHRRPVEATLFAAMTLAGIGSYFVQATGFQYHGIPFRAFALVACLLLVLRCSRPNALVIAALIAASVLTSFYIMRGFYRSDAASEIAETVQSMEGVSSLMVVSTYVSAGPPAAIASDTSWVSRYPANWLVPGALNRIAETDCLEEPLTCIKLSAIGARNLSGNIADIEAHHPDLLVFDKATGYIDIPDFSWEAFMAENPKWPPIFADYAPAGETARFVYYRYAPGN